MFIQSTTASGKVFRSYVLETKCEKYSKSMHNYGTKNHIHFLMLFVFTSSRYQLIFLFLPSRFIYILQILMLMVM